MRTLSSPGSWIAFGSTPKISVNTDDLTAFPLHWKIKTVSHVPVQTNTMVRWIFLTNEVSFKFKTQHVITVKRINKNYMKFLNCKVKNFGATCGTVWYNYFTNVINNILTNLPRIVSYLLLPNDVFFRICEFINYSYIVWCNYTHLRIRIILVPNIVSLYI